jgi:hypothetical protein
LKFNEPGGLATSRFFCCPVEIRGRKNQHDFPAMSESEAKPSLAFLPYPVSTLSPPIIPNDLTSFKSRGISQVERELQQKLKEIRETYLQTIDHFNWNKLVYEAEIQFEPIVGETYHVYEMRGRRQLSMIAPDQWAQKLLASVRLDVDRQWKVVATGPDVDSRELFGTVEA